MYWLSLTFIGTTLLAASDSDEALASSFSSSHACKTLLKDSLLTVKVENRVLVLSGQVLEDCQRQLAEETARRLPGVGKVENRLEVQLDEQADADQRIQARVRDVLAMHRNAAVRGARIDSHNGVVHLLGTAPTDGERNQASSCTEDIDGVVGVINEMTIEQAPNQADKISLTEIDDPTIAAMVKVALQLHRSTRFASAEIVCIGGVVTVTGKARTLAEKNVVARVTAEIVGVREVRNNLSIEPWEVRPGLRPAPVQNLRLSG